jgi:tol-pal system protein YbgF
MSKSSVSAVLPLILTIAVILILSGCGSSKPVIEDDEWADQWEQPVDERQQQIDQLSTENQQLREEIARINQENRNLNARIAEMEKRLLEERERARPEVTEVPAQPQPVDRTVTLESFDREYNRAFNLFMNRNYSEAREIFTKLLNSGINHPLIPNCQYWIGESQFGMREYRQAIDSFQKVFDYPTQVKHDDAQIMIANSFFMLGDRARARQEYQRLIDRYPNSDYTAFARQRLSEL